MVDRVPGRAEGPVGSLGCILDTHTGVKPAIASVLIGASWQRVHSIRQCSIYPDGSLAPMRLELPLLQHDAAALLAILVLRPKEPHHHRPMSRSALQVQGRSVLLNGARHRRITALDADAPVRLCNPCRRVAGTRSAVERMATRRSLVRARGSQRDAPRTSRAARIPADPVSCGSAMIQPSRSAVPLASRNPSDHRDPFQSPLSLTRPG